MRAMEYEAFLKNVGVRSALGEDNPFVKAAILREVEVNGGKLYQERMQAVADAARQEAAGYKSVFVKEEGGERRELGPNADTMLRSKTLAKRLEPWARELRQEGFSSPDAPFPGDLAVAADWIETQSAADKERWLSDRTSRVDADAEIKRLADLAGLVVNPVSRFLKYARPNDGHQKNAGVYPGTFLDRLARETGRVSETTPFQPEVLTAFVLTGLQPMISRVRTTETSKVCRVPGDNIPSRWVTLRFNAADVSYEEVRTLYAEIREFFGVTDTARLHWHEFDFITLVDDMGGPPEHSRTRFWEEVLWRWNETVVSRDLELSSWRAARNKYERLEKRRLRELITPNPPMSLAERKQWLEAVRKQSERLGPPKLVKDAPVRRLE